MSTLARGAGGHGAQNTVSGEISNGATWYEDITITDDSGNQVTGISSDDFQFQFRKERDAGIDLTLSTTDSTLTIVEGVSSTVLQIRVPQPTIAGMEGDYFADLVSKAASDDRLIHRAHGTVTFRNDPIAF